MVSRSSVEYLRKSDLQFEVQIRGQSHDLKVDELRRVLRQLLTLNVLPDKTTIDLKDVEEQISLCQSNLYLLKSDLENLEESSNKIDIVRFKNRLNCFVNRIAFLQEVCEFKQTEEFDEALNALSEENTKLLTEFNSKYQLVSPRIDTDQVGVNDLEGINLNAMNNNPAVINTNVQVPASNILSNNSLESNNPFTENNNQLFPGNQTQYENVPGIQISAPVQPVKVVSCYSKMKHPGESILSQIPKTDGFSVDNVLKFFRITLRLLAAFPELRPQIFSLVVPYCQGPFLNCLLQNRTDNDFDKFHSIAIKSFIPERQLSVITQNLYLRKQELNEKLPEYIRGIKEAAALLRLEASENRMVNTIIEGLNFRVRACAAFCVRPSNFNELDEFCIHVMNVQYLHGGDSLDKKPTVVSMGGPSQDFSRGTVRRPIICHYCRKVGHIKPNCPELKNRSSKNL